MNFVITDGMVDLTVLVGIIFGILAAGFIAYGEVQRRRGSKTRTKETSKRGSRKSGRAGKSR